MFEWKIKTRFFYWFVIRKRRTKLQKFERTCTSSCRTIESPDLQLICRLRHRPLLHLHRKRVHLRPGKTFRDTKTSGSVQPENRDSLRPPIRSRVRRSPRPWFRPVRSNRPSTWVTQSRLILQNRSIRQSRSNQLSQPGITDIWKTLNFLINFIVVAIYYLQFI